MDMAKVKAHIALDDKAIVQNWLENKLIQNIEDQDFKKPKLGNQ